MLPKAKLGARTEALFSIWRQTEGTFKGWLGDGKTAHSRTRSGLFLASWWSANMNGEVRAGGLRRSLPALVRQVSEAGRPQAAPERGCLQRGLPRKAGAAALPSESAGEEIAHPWEPQTHRHLKHKNAQNRRRADLNVKYASWGSQIRTLTKHRNKTSLVQ